MTTPNTTEKPRITLTPLEKTVVHTPTQQDYDTLMRVYECGGWITINGKIPTKFPSHFPSFFEYAYDAGICRGQREKFGWWSTNQAIEDDKTVILPEDFYEIQNVSLRQILQINRWFDAR